MVVAIADRELIRLTESSVANLDEAFVLAAGEEQLRDIRRQMSILDRQGIESIYADADDLGEKLREAYLRSKMSGRL